MLFRSEEALGYSVDPQSVNDKDGISAALVLAEIASKRKEAGSSLAEMLDEIWIKYGFHGTRQLSIRTNRIEDISSIMKKLRSQLPSEIAGYKVSKVDDLERPDVGLPPTNGLRIWLDGKYRVIVRPSGTEPKLKCYIEVVSPSRQLAEPIINRIELEFRSLMQVA